MKKIGFIFLLLVIVSTIYGQNLHSDEELFLRDPNPRFHGKQVEQLQRYLLFCGFDIGSDGIDGWFGNDTHNALLAYQRHKGLVENGRIRISDIPTELKLDPVYSLWSGSVENSTKTILRSAAEHTISNIFGSYRIITENEYGEFYYDLVASPSGRFVVGAFTYPQAETSLPVGLWDVLTQTHLMIWPFETLNHVQAPGYNVPDDEFNYDRMPHIIEYYWDADDSLYLRIEDDVDEDVIIRVLFSQSS